MLRSMLKRMTPIPLRRRVRHIITYLSRLDVWRRVMFETAGAGANDQRILRRSFYHGVATAGRDLDIWKDPHLVANARVCVPDVGEFSIRAHTDDLYHVLPSREAAVVAAIRNRLRSGATFIDAGANIGFFTVLASQLVGNTGRVFAIEMMPETASRLREHVATNHCSDIVTIFETAISDRGGELISAVMPEAKFGRASIILEPEHERKHHVQVHTETLDALMDAFNGPIELIKMDLEGAEERALLGAPEILKRTRAIIFEQLPGEKGAAQLLEQSGFALKVLDGNNILAVRD